MQKLRLTLALPFAGAHLTLAQSSAPQWDASQIVIGTSQGPIFHAVTYAPKPVLPPPVFEQHLSGRGIYVVDIVNGIVEDVRVLRSSGHKILDDAALKAIWTWHFRPHRLIKATVAIDFGVLIQQSRLRSTKS